MSINFSDKKTSRTLRLQRAADGKMFSNDCWEATTGVVVAQLKVTTLTPPPHSTFRTRLVTHKHTKLWTKLCFYLEMIRRETFSVYFEDAR